MCLAVPLHFLQRSVTAVQAVAHHVLGFPHWWMMLAAAVLMYSERCVAQICMLELPIW
jgi:hypothetical protein